MTEPTSYLLNQIKALPASWQSALASDLQDGTLSQLDRFLAAEAAAGKEIYPPREKIFAALHATPLEKVKVVILGQDPYFRAGQAEGLSFSVARGITRPPSLRSIFKELESDLAIPAAEHGSLHRWAAEGVLLLNAVLTVEAGKAGSHANRGWEEFTDAVIRAVERESDGTVFLLWGAYAQKKAEFLGETRHLVIKSAHPSPRAARHGFFGSKPFSRANAWLDARGKTPVDWRLD